MKKTRSAKRALLMSALSLLLCVSMLVGTTFAWFTDSVTSAGNVIQSGTLDVDMIDAQGNSMAGQVIEFVAVDGRAQDEILWEPGCTYKTEPVKVVNLGNLALKYELHINGIDGNAKLLEAIEWTVTIGGVETDLASYEGKLYPKAGEDISGEIVLSGHMKEEAGNEYQGLKAEGISIVVYATQLTHENDSFGNQYDAGLTPLEGDEVLVEENGIQYVYTPKGEVYLYLVTAGYAEDTVVVPEGITNIGNYAFAYNNNVKKVVLPSTVKSLGRGFDSSNVETVILNEGLEVIDSRAFKSTLNLKEVVISSTVKTIADNAFQKSGIKNIVIPATVETIGETAFGSSMIESVTFEGNTSIQGFAFRGCSKLRTVHMEGNDVTFIPSTLSGKNSMWFCNGESNNPNTSNITFYVENNTVAERVKTAMGAEANNTPVYVKNVVADAAGLKDALSSGEKNIALPKGELSLPTLSGKDGITLIGTKGTVIGGANTATGFGGNFGKNTTIKNVTFSGSSNGVRSSYAQGGTSVFENCTFAGDGTYGFHIDESNGATFIFKNCTFSGFNAFAGDLTKVVFENCTFKNNGNYGHTNIWSVGEFNGCTFEAGTSVGPRGDNATITIDGVAINEVKYF